MYSKEFLQDQADFLNALLNFEGPLEELKKRNKITTLDWELRPLVTVTRAHVISVLERFIKGELSERDVYDWCLEMAYRETIEHELGYGELLDGIISSMIGDIPAGFPLTVELAQKYINELMTTPYDFKDAELTKKIDRDLYGDEP